MTTIEHLRAARALIEKGWCKGTYAKDQEGNVCQPFEQEAVSFCIVGALVKSNPNKNGSAFHTLRSFLGDDFLDTWNDDPTRTKADVLALFDKAIALEESKGGHNE